MAKTIFLCVSNESDAACPICGNLLRYRDSRLRIRKNPGGSKSYIQIRRLKCSHCHTLHNELPDIISPHKHYSAAVIEEVADGVIGADDIANEDYPCESTMIRWRGWLLRNKAYIEGALLSAGYRILGLGRQIFKSCDLLLIEIRDAGPGWLGKITRIIYNSGNRVPV